MRVARCEVRRAQIRTARLIVSGFYNCEGFVKDIVYSQKPRNIDDLRVKITQAFQQITPLMLQLGLIDWTLQLVHIHYCLQTCISGPTMSVTNYAICIALV
ncbi:hypothetical protein ANN_01611 [Periplaneta americana]|uniref:Uncharacterized protein n=1 Tax=Periplaneta americana TaxID=6978 RepID=A0ABQ8TU34_PERAM|nr:hypothetical protein ANN_01611 [Periplaneta americana]